MTSKLRLFLISLLLFLGIFASPTTTSQAIWLNMFEREVSEWQAGAGDYITLDLSTNTGFLNSVDGLRTASFPIVTGQKNVVRYIGLRYWAETPVREWVMKKKNIKGDRVTFGKTGKFFRLFDDNNFTHYGIHAYRYGDDLLSLTDKDRYKSMGCILVSDDVLAVIEGVFEKNKGRGVRVVTYKG